MRLRTIITCAALTVVSLVSVSTARAQTGVYVQFTGQSDKLSGTGWFVGPAFGIYQDRHSLTLLHVGYDIRGAVLTHSTQHVYSGLGGARLSLVPHIVPVKVYAEALGGVARQDNASLGSSTNFQYQVNAGAEYTVLPRIDWRVIEVAYNGYSGNTGGNPVGLSSGIVFRLP